MSGISENHLELLIGIQKNELLKALIEQINKDMNLAGINHQIETNSVPNILCEDLSKTIFKLLHNNDPKLQNLLYRVDVPENHNIEMQNDNIRIRSQKLSIIILKKECQKLWFKSRN